MGTLGRSCGARLPSNCREVGRLHQADLPPVEALLPNQVPNYPETVGLPVTLRMTGPTTRPELAFDRSSIHPFALECRNGVCIHRVMEWLENVG